MKGWRAAAIISAVLLIAAVAFAGYMYSTAKIEITAVNTRGGSCADDPAKFEDLKESLTAGTFMGTIYQKPQNWKTAQDYIYLTYTVSLQNNCFVPIDMIELQIVPNSYDIAQLGDFAVHSLEERSSGDFNATILTSKDTASVREIIITYYVWGVSFSLHWNLT